jgi:general secretion pathway protein G
MIMALVSPRVLNYLGESRVKAAKIDCGALLARLNFYLDAGRFPTGSEGLTALVRPVSGVSAWNGPYVKGGTVPNDPWGNPYVYKQPAEQAPYEIRSLGSDGQEGGTGTATDLTSAAQN